MCNMRGGRLVVLQHSLLLFDIRTAICQQKLGAKIRASLPIDDLGDSITYTLVHDLL